MDISTFTGFGWAMSLVYLSVCALADSFAGGSLGKKAKALDEAIPGRAAFWGAVLIALVGVLAFGVWGAAMGLVWLIYRTPDWDIFGGSATPVTPKEIAGTLARHAIALLAAPVALFAGRSLIVAAVAFGLFAVAATLLAVAYSRANLHAQRVNEAIDPMKNRLVELSRGAAFGVAVAASLWPFPNV